MTSALAAFLIFAPPQFNWQPVLDKIAPYSSGFQVSSSREANVARFTSLMKKAGLETKIDGQDSLDDPAYYINVHSNAVQVQGGNGFVIWISRDEPNSKAYRSVIAYFESVQGKPAASILWAGSASEDVDAYAPILPVYACRSGSTLVISGRYNWLSVYPEVAVHSYRYRNGKWHFVNQKVSEGDCENPAKLKLTRSGVIGIEPITGTSFPKYMQSSHGEAVLVHDTKWSIQDGKVVTNYSRVRPTPYAQLDNLCLALKHGNYSEVRQLCQSAAVAKKVFALGEKLGSGWPTVRYPWPEGDVGNPKVGLVESGCWFHFDKKDGKWVVAKLTPMGDQ